MSLFESFDYVLELTSDQMAIVVHGLDCYRNELEDAVNHKKACLDWNMRMREQDAQLIRKGKPVPKRVIEGEDDAVILEALSVLEPKLAGVKALEKAIADDWKAAILKL